MKKAISILLVLLALSSCKTEPENKTVILSGNIKNAPSKTIKLIGLQKDTLLINMDENFRFFDTLTIPESYYKMYVGGQYTWLYLKPGFNLKLSTDYKDFDKSLKYEGEGADINNYFAEKMLLGVALKPKTNYNYYGNLKEEEFVKLQDSIYQVKENLLKQLNDKDFVAKEHLRNKLDKAKFLSRYEPVRAYLTKNTEFKVSSQFPKPYQGININDTLLKQIPNAAGEVANYVDYKVANENKDAEIDPYDKLSFLDKNIKDPDLKEELAYQMAQYNLMYTKQLEKFYELFDKIVQNPKYKQEIKAKYDNIKTLQPGAPSPDFTAYDINGKEYHLKDFAGKPLYIDLWATWCGPCLAEIPHLDKLKEQYKDKPISFLSLSVYDDQKKWEQMVKNQNFTGWQLINTDRNMPFLKKYVVDGIPRFILLDKEGKIIDANAPRPSDKSLVSLLDKTLAEK